MYPPGFFMKKSGKRTGAVHQGVRSVNWKYSGTTGKLKSDNRRKGNRVEGAFCKAQGVDAVPLRSGYCG